MDHFQSKMANPSKLKFPIFPFPIQKMSVEILSKETIKPSSPTPQELRCFKLSFLDQLAPSSYIPTILFYNYCYKHDQDGVDDDVLKFLARLKHSLAETLAIFYPLAGRFKDLVSIDCNDEGAVFVEAQVVGFSMAQFLESPDIGLLNSFLPCKANSLEKSWDQPLVAVQVTRFPQGGGLVVGTCMHHKAGDTAAVCGFLDTWTKMARGLSEEVARPDLQSGPALFPARDSLSGDFVSTFDLYYFQGKKSNKMKRFVFDAAAIDTLKKAAATEAIPHPSRIVALTAFVCKRVMASARRVKNGASESSLLITHPVNMRQRMHPPLPRNSFGNLIWLSYGLYDATNTDTIDLPSLSETVTEMLVSVNNDNIRGMDPDDVFTTLTEVMGSVVRTENLKILRFTSWCKLGFYEVDFGVGKPVWVSDMGDTAEGFQSKQHFLFVDSKCGKKIEMWMAYDEDDISALESDPEFLAYATPNPSVCMH